jgi:hypothetical protein
MKDDITAKAFQQVAKDLARAVALRNANLETTKKVEFTVHTAPNH